MKKWLFVIFCSVIIGGGSFFFLASLPAADSNIGHGGAQSGGGPNDYSFGSSGLNSKGWLIPSNVLISQTYTTTRPISLYMNAIANIIPYEIQSGTYLYIGLYINGILSANSSYDLSAGHFTEASPIQTLESGSVNVDNFSSVVESYPVVLFLNNSIIPLNSKVTVTVFATKPIWFQVGDAKPSAFYLPSSSYLPRSLPTVFTSSNPAGLLTAPCSLGLMMESYVAS